jgi:iron complex outermembrane receptor protein
MLQSALPCAILGLGFVGTASNACAQSATTDSGVVDEIVVTAQRREQRLLEVPVAVSAVSGDRLADAGVRNASQLVNVLPSVQFTNTGPTAVFSIRGIKLNDYGDTNESPIAFYLDDVYIGPIAGAVSNLFDVERVEVLRGPQGTLFGRNATGGLVQVISKKPTAEFAGDASLQVGNFGQVIVEGAAGGAITDRLRSRTAFIYNRDDGWQTNVPTNTKTAKTKSWSARQLLDFDVTDNLSALLNIHGGYTDNISPQYGARGALDPTTLVVCSDARILRNECVTFEGFRGAAKDDPTKTYSNLPSPKYQVETFGASLTATHKGEVATVTSVTAYEMVDKFYQEDADGTPTVLYDLDYNVHSEQFSQELRADGTIGSVDLTSGLFYYYLKHSDGLMEGTALTPLFGTYGLKNEYEQSTWAGAAFVQADYHVNETVTLTAGARYSSETKKLRIADDFSTPTFLENYKAKTDRLTWRLAANWKFTPEWMAYASVATGFKSPAFNTALVVEGGAAPVGRESNINYEVGAKGTLFDKRLQLAVSVFHTKYKDFQIVAIPDPNLPASRLTNVPEAVISGAEFEIDARPFQGMRVNFAATYLDTEIHAPGFIIAGYPIDNNPLGLSPTWSLKGSAQYSFPETSIGTFTVRAGGSYQSDQNKSKYRELDTLPADGLLDAGVSFEPTSGRYRLEVFGENLTDEVYDTYRFQLVDFFARQWGKPRTYGVRISTSW